MITPKEIKEKAERKYISFLQIQVENKPFEKLVIRGDKSYSKSSLSEFEKEIQQIISQSKDIKGFGYILEFQKVKTKSLGVQDLPISIFFDTKKDFLKFLGKEKEVELFKTNVELIINKFPELNDWVINNPLKVINNQSEWENILKVCQYFKQNPKPNLYIRELPINVHTKFIEINKSVIRELLDLIIPASINLNEIVFEKRYNLKYPEPLIRFKILDNEICSKYFQGIDDISIPVSQFKALDLPIQNVLVVENKTNLLTIALTLPELESSIVIFGSGFKVENLKTIGWLKIKRIFYWGDLDVHGFEILSQFRGYFPQVRNVLMDKTTFDCFFEEDEGVQSKLTTKLNLTKEEYELYDIIRQNNWRLEQEKIPMSYANKHIIASMTDV